MTNVSTTKILIIDDAAPQVRALCDTLQDHGYEVAGFTSCADALQTLHQTRFDLLLSDLMMPAMDGVSLLAAATRIDPDIAGIIMTGQGTITTAVDAMKVGAYDYIQKPFKLNAILPVLARAVARRRLRIKVKETNQRRLEHAISHDSLTDLPNRNRFIERLSQGLGLVPAGRTGGALAVVLTDLARFKNVNDSLGRDVGDALLQQVAERLRGVVADPGVPARVGADTYAWMVDAFTHVGEMISQLRQCLAEVFAQPFTVAGHEIRIGAHTGISLSPGDGQDATTLFHNAEAALKYAKAHRQSIALYSAGMNAHVSEQVAMESRLRRAVERNEFVLHFQPKVDSKSGNITAAVAA